MAKYKAYPEYKDSGVEWLGRIPRDWQVIATKYIAQLTPKKSAIPRNKLFEACSFVPMEKLKFNTLVLDEEKVITQVYDGYTYFEDGDILISKVTPCFENKNMAIAENLKNNIGFGSSEIYVLRCSEQVHRKFLFYRLQEDSFMAIAIAAMSGAGGLKRVPAETVNSYLLGLPEWLEQVKIIAFLDHETAKIDNLIEKQQQLIELLKEKRQAVISHAVTKGLNPDVPMKDSGGEWLGEMPEHWEVKRCKTLFDFVTSGSRGWAGFYSDEGDLFFRIANLTRDNIDPKLESLQYVSPPKGSEGERSRIKENDILISITADLGSVCTANEKISGGYVSQHVALCRPNKVVSASRWLAYFLISDAAKEQFQGAGYGGTKIQLSLEDIRELYVAYPPKVEQEKIASYLDKRLLELSDLDYLAHNLINLLQERRTALISAAVTGKIDVRDWVAPVTQSAEESAEASL